MQVSTTLPSAPLCTGCSMARTNSGIVTAHWCLERTSLMKASQEHAKIGRPSLSKKYFVVHLGEYSNVYSSVTVY